LTDAFLAVTPRDHRHPIGDPIRPVGRVHNPFGVNRMVSRRTALMSALAAGLALGLVGPAAAGECKAHASTKFEGKKANTGFAIHTKAADGRQVLTLSDDFQIPEAPAPHWQIVDSHGNVYLLNMLKIKGDKFNKQITLPAYIADVAKVQIWCSFAESLLGEASFPTPVK
jgi:hypothetical protein